MIRIQDVIPTTDIPYSLFNIGNNEPIELARFIKAIEIACGCEADKIMLQMLPINLAVATQGQAPSHSHTAFIKYWKYYAQ